MSLEDTEGDEKYQECPQCFKRVRPGHIHSCIIQDSPKHIFLVEDTLSFGCTVDKITELTKEGYLMESGKTLLFGCERHWKQVKDKELNSFVGGLQKVECKKDDGKLRWDILPFWAMDKVVKVLTLGEIKYPSTEEGLNWYVHSKPEDLKRYKAAILRHMSTYMQGVSIDEESGEHHLAHIVANCLFLIELEKKYEV